MKLEEAEAIFDGFVTVATNELHDGPLDAMPRERLEVLVRDALHATGLLDFVKMYAAERDAARALRDEAERWRGRASRADDRDTCEHCGTKEGDLTRSAVACQPCLVKLLTQGEMKKALFSE